MSIIAAIFGKALASLATLLEAVIKLLRAIPAAVYAWAFAVLLMASLIALLETENQLQAVRKSLNDLASDYAVASVNYETCNATLFLQNQKITDFQVAATNAEARANAALREAEVAAAPIRTRIQQRNALPQPAPDQQCQATESLLNEALANRAR